MKCPRECASPLTAETLSGVEVDRCPDCDGLWLDLGEGELVTRPGEAEIPQEVLDHLARMDPTSQATGDDSPPLSCPRCGKTMGRERYSTSGVIVDRCGCGMWLDAGELERIQAHRVQALEELKASQGGGYPAALYERAVSRFYFDLGTPPDES